MKQAIFDHVTNEGTLILSVDGEKIALAINDDLERGILSAKQIHSENKIDQTAADTSALPISQIQSAVRHGEQISDIANRFDIAESLVRRFAAPVETEKHYAIAQFFATRTQNSSETVNLEEIINHNLRESGIDPETVEWEATKQNRTPWKIIAHFSSKNLDYKATWMWNLRDNSVVSIDPMSKRLLGEEPSAGMLLFGQEPANTSSRSIEETLNGRGPLPPQWLNDDAEKPSSETNTENPQEFANSEQQKENIKTELGSQNSNAETSENTDTSSSAHVSTNLPEKTSPTSDAHNNSHSQISQSSDSSTVNKEQNDNDNKHSESLEKKNRKRSIIPSWDDILFGD